MVLLDGGHQNCDVRPNLYGHLLLSAVIRDYDGHVYVREWGGGILGGGFEPLGKPVFHEGIPDKFEHQLLPEDWDHFRESRAN